MKGFLKERNRARARLTDMARWALAGAVLLCVLPSSAQPTGAFSGQLGTLDSSLLGEDWYRLRPSDMPAVPLEGATVSVLDCEEDCPDPVLTDAAGWFTIPDLGRDSARLHFEPPACADDEPECETLEPREEEFVNGSRTVLGAKWPSGVEDTVLRYMPSVAGAIYVKWKGEIPGLSGACGSASSWIVISTVHCRSDAFNEHQTFVHEITHLYEMRLRNACGLQRHDVGGWILQEDWLRAVEADRIYREENGLKWVGEYPIEGLNDRRISMETLASFAEEYFTPQQIVRNRRAKYPSVPIENYKTYKDMEVYAPNRYAYFEKIVFERYLDEKQWNREHPGGEEWPGLCEAPSFDEDEEDSGGGGGVVWPFGSKSSSSPASLSYSPEDPGPAICSFPASPLMRDTTDAR